MSNQQKKIGFCQIPMVRINFYFHGVSEKQRLAIQEVIFGVSRQYRGGSGGPFESCHYYYTEDVPEIIKKLKKAGLPELTVNEMFGDH